MIRKYVARFLLEHELIKATADTISPIALGIPEDHLGERSVRLAMAYIRFANSHDTANAYLLRTSETRRNRSAILHQRSGLVEFR